MNFKNLISSLFVIVAFTLVIAVLLPSAVKLSHAFNHHTHQVCDDDNQNSTHYHQTDLDCDFYKFKLTNQFYFNSDSFEFIQADKNFNISASQYQFISDFQKLQIALRGPPQLI